MINCDACGFGHKEHHEVKICHLEADLATAREQVQRLTEALTWMSRNRALTIFIEESNQVAAFFKKCDAALTPPAPKETP